MIVICICFIFVGKRIVSNDSKVAPKSPSKVRVVKRLVVASKIDDPIPIEIVQKVRESKQITNQESHYSDDFDSDIIEFRSTDSCDQNERAIDRRSPSNSPKLTAKKSQHQNTVTINRRLPIKSKSKDCGDNDNYSDDSFDRLSSNGENERYEQDDFQYDSNIEEEFKSPKVIRTNFTPPNSMAQDQFNLEDFLRPPAASDKERKRSRVGNNKSVEEIISDEEENKKPNEVNSVQQKKVPDKKVLVKQNQSPIPHASSPTKAPRIRIKSTGMTLANNTTNDTPSLNLQHFNRTRRSDIADDDNSFYSTELKEIFDTLQPPPAKPRQVDPPIQGMELISGRPYSSSQRYRPGTTERSRPRSTDMHSRPGSTERINPGMQLLSVRPLSKSGRMGSPNVQGGDIAGQGRRMSSAKTPNNAVLVRTESNPGPNSPHSRERNPSTSSTIDCQPPIQKTAKISKKIEALPTMLDLKMSKFRGEMKTHEKEKNVTSMDIDEFKKLLKLHKKN